MIDPAFYDFMGSQHPGYTGLQGPSWQMPDTANTSSIRPFYFHGGMRQVWWSTWTIIWRPGQNGTSRSRLIAMDTGGPGYGTWETLVEFVGPPNSGPIVTGVDITGKMNQFVNDKISKYIGFQMWDDGVHPYTIWEARLEVNWLLPEAAAPMRLGLISMLDERPPIGEVKHAVVGDLINLPQPPVYA